jgi:hypothetical protein
MNRVRTFLLFGWLGLFLVLPALANAQIGGKFQNLCSLLSGQASQPPKIVPDDKKPSQVLDIVVTVDGKKLNIFKDSSLVWNDLLGKVVTLELTLSNAKTIKPKVTSAGGFILRLLGQVKYMGYHWEKERDGTRIAIPAAAIREGANNTLIATYVLTDREKEKLRNAKKTIQKYDELVAMAFQGYTGTFQLDDAGNKLQSEKIGEWLFNTHRRAIIKPE